MIMMAKILQIVVKSLNCGEGRTLQVQRRVQNPCMGVSMTTIFGVPVETTVMECK
jgi:hypothetical protein